MWSNANVFIFVLQSIIASGNYVGGNYVTANVTKESSSTRIIYLNTTKSTPKPVSQTRAATDADSKLTKAISVNADSSGGYAVFPLPPPPTPIPPFFSGTGGVEETFTYQVKKQRQRPSQSQPDFKMEFGFLKAKAMADSNEVQNFATELNSDTKEKIHNLTKAMGIAKDEINAFENIFNSTMNLQAIKVANLTALSNETSRSVKHLKYAFEQDKGSLMQQVSNLTMLIEHLQRERYEERERMRAELSRLQVKVDNTTDEIRVHEAHLRYGQQTMLSLRNSVEKNANQIANLERSGGPQWVEQTIGCGGVVVANSGLISYKFRQPYLNNERCVWTIRANTRSKINLQLLEDGFQNQSNSDFLTVTEFTDTEYQHPVTLITSTRLEHGSKGLHTFEGPVIFVTFYSDSSLPGTGFTLRFDGVGNITDPLNINAIRHSNLHYSLNNGLFAYPSDENGVTYQPNELMTVAINPNNSANSMKIQMKWSDLEKDEYCEFDSINFYGSVQGSYALTKRYCQQDEKFNGEIIHSSDGIFLVIFRSDASTQFSGFQFTWEAN